MSSSEAVEKKMKNKDSIKQPGKMKRNLEEKSSCNVSTVKETPTSQSDIGNKLFESLLVFGPDKNQLAELPKEIYDSAVKK